MTDEYPVLSMPYAPLMEKSVLSSLMKHPEKFDEVPHLTAGHFFFPAYRFLFEKLIHLRDTDQSLDLVMLGTRFSDEGILDHLGGLNGLADVYTFAVNAYCFEPHLKVLTEKLALRNALALSREITEVIGEGKTPEEVEEVVAAGALTIADTLAEVRPVKDTPALVRSSAARWEAMAKGEADPMGIQTSLAEINQAFCGLKPSRVTVISARPAEGKSLLGGQLFMDAVSQGHRGLFLTWEMTADELMDRCVAYHARLPLDAVANPVKYAREIEGRESPSPETGHRVLQAFREVEGFPAHIAAMHGQGIAQAAAMIRRERRKGELGIVVLDFVQRIGPSRHLERQTFERQLADIADRFQNLAQDYGFHGIVLSQLNKEGGPKHAEAINECCSLHLKIVNTPEIARDGTPVLEPDGRPKIKRRGIGVMKDRFHGQSDAFLPIGLNRQTQRFERLHFGG